MKKIQKKEGKCIKEGFVKKINKINKITFHKFYEQNFSGSVLFNVEFNAEIISVEVDEIIECKIVKASEDGIVAQGEYPIFVIIDGDYENLDFLDVGDIINIQVLKYETTLDRNIIKTVGKYISNKELDIDNNNNE